MHTRDCVYIDGRWVPANGEGKIEVVNPTTEEEIGSVPIGDVTDVNLSLIHI